MSIRNSHKCISIPKSIFLLFFVVHFATYVEANQQNNTLHHVRRSREDDSFFKNQKQGSYRSYEPVSIKYHKTTYPKTDDRTDYDINSYDTEYGEVTSNFTSSVYDDKEGPLYPNPDDFSKNLANKMEKAENEVELPDDSLGDGDLKEHNIIDSVTYLYGFNNCNGERNEGMTLIFVNKAITLIMLLALMMWLMWSKTAENFRNDGKLYPIVINLCCCLVACALIYVQAVLGVASPSQCERVALLLHYTYMTCATWILALAASLTEHCAYGSFMPLKYNYLFAYGIPAFIVMFNYALSMEQYEIKNYCWMSLEKGMVMGFMAPVMILIIINTAIILIGLTSVYKKQSDSLRTNLQEFLDRHEANVRKNGTREGNNIGSVINNTGIVENLYIAGTSRKNTDSSETLDKEDNAYDDNCYVNMDMPNENNEGDNEANNQGKENQEHGGILTIYATEPLWLKWTLKTEGSELKRYLNLCLVLEPFFAINWAMGVAAIENSSNALTAIFYLVLELFMYGYFVIIISMTLPILTKPPPISTRRDDIVGEPPLAPTSSTTDSIPLLEPAVQQPNVTAAPADTISTISI